LLKLERRTIITLEKILEEELIPRIGHSFIGDDMMRLEMRELPKRSEF